MAAEISADTVQKLTDKFKSLNPEIQKTVGGLERINANLVKIGGMAARISTGFTSIGTATRDADNSLQRMGGSTLPLIGLGFAAMANQAKTINPLMAAMQTTLTTMALKIAEGNASLNYWTDLVDDFQSELYINYETIKKIANQATVVSRNMERWLPTKLQEGLKIIEANIKAIGDTGMKVFTRLGAVMLYTTSVASPAQFEQFTLAMRDLAGVVGAALLPVLRGLTVVVREIADFFVNLPGWLQTSVAIVVALALAFAAVAIILSTMITVIKTLAAAFTALWASMGPVGWFILAIGALVALLSFLLRRIRGSIPKSSVGAGGREISYMSGEEVQRRALAAALKTPGEDPAETAKRQREDILKELRLLNQRRRRGWDNDQGRN